MHQCPAASCTIDVPHHMFMCARHWRMVPRPLRQAIYQAWRGGNLQTHRENAREAIRVVNGVENARSGVGLPRGTKALTLWQPWASLIMLGAKPHEFRRWNFSDRPHLEKLIGQRIVIHAGARPVRDDELIDLLDRIEEGESALDAAVAKPFVEELLYACKHERPGIAPLASALGTATLGAPRNVVDLFKDKIADSDRLDEHMYGWPMIDPQPFAAPIPAAGAQGFWNWA